MLRALSFMLISHFLLLSITITNGYCQKGGVAAVKSLERKNSKNQSRVILNKDRVVINRGTPKDMSADGIYLWLDKQGLWQLRWHGEPGKMVWVRFEGENDAGDVNVIGEKTKYFISNDISLTVMGLSDRKLQGISFSSDTEFAILDAKWGDDISSEILFLGERSAMSEVIPLGLFAPYFKGKKKSYSSFDESKIKRDKMDGSNNVMASPRGEK
ncbi:hypothetical protein P9J64_00570 [Deltaproteobacteria bacterium IMCC39524]|nr:hypothetical protein [Deltaproteobacteria bacterium IMCC39524]